MSFTACVTCGHKFTKVGPDIPYADGGVLEVLADFLNTKRPESLPRGIQGNWGKRGFTSEYKTVTKVARPYVDTCLTIKAVFFCVDRLKVPFETIVKVYRAHRGSRTIHHCSL